MNHNIANMVAEKVAEKVKQSREDDLIEIIDIISQGVTEFSLKDLGNIERRIIGFIRRREFNEKLFRILFQFMHNTRNSYGIICASKYGAIKCSVSDIPMLLEYRSKCGIKQ